MLRDPVSRIYGSPFWETGPNRRQASDTEGKPPPYPGGEGVCTGPDFPGQSNLIARSEVPIAMCPVFNQDAAAATEFASGLSARTAAVSAGDAVLFDNAHRRETKKAPARPGLQVDRSGTSRGTNPLGSPTIAQSVR